jgi:hypothetical protein
LNPESGSVRRLTEQNPPLWDFRATESPNGNRIVFCRCGVGELPSLWVMNTLGGAEYFLTRGLGESGADHPRWLPRASESS